MVEILASDTESDDEGEENWGPRKTLVPVENFVTHEGDLQGARHTSERDQKEQHTIIDSTAMITIPTLNQEQESERSGSENEKDNLRPRHVVIGNA